MIALTWNIALALIWVFLTGSFTSGSLLVGFVLGYLLLALTLRDKPAFAGYTRRVPRFFAFIVFFLKELFVSNMKVAYDVLTPSHSMVPGVIAFPLEAKTDGEITILANVIALTPGTLSLDVSSDRKVMYVHVMYLDDREAVFRSLKHLEHYVLGVLR